MIPTFTKLFVISIVANKRSESARKARIRSSEACFPSSTALISVGDKEKKAISEADANPEHNNKTIAINKAIIAPTLGDIMATSSKRSKKPDKNVSESKTKNLN